MCGLFGFVHYGNNGLNNLSDLTKSLAEYSAVRGTDATGFAYVRNNNIQILKEAKSAYTFNIKHPDNIVSLIGHTRHSTHGDARKNYNNHPFSGKAGNTRFALAHNGVLLNNHLSLPKTKIQTDSYAAVQLIEQQKKLSFNSIRTMSETVSGSFSFSILDDMNTLWLVKGDSPLSMLHFPQKQIYVYASTTEILFKSIIVSPLFEELKKRQYEEISIPDGTIMKISSDGKTDSEQFKYYEQYYRPGWWEFGYFTDLEDVNYTNTDYLDALKSTAMYNGIEPEHIDYMIDAGYTLEEIEDALYEL